MKTLLIEDDADLRAILSYALRQRGFDVETAEQGAPAVAACARLRPDAIILDVGWSDPLGLDTLTRLREAGTPSILALTTLNDPDHFAECLLFGATEVLLKPFPLQHLTQRLRALAWCSERNAAAPPQRLPRAPEPLRPPGGHQPRRVAEPPRAVASQCARADEPPLPFDLAE